MTEKRATLSVYVVTFNEEANIRDCLESVKWADEIIVVDSHSTDRTADIAREYTEHVIQRPWPGYVAQKNFALDQTNCDWVLLIDADERVSPELAEEIQDLLSRDDIIEAGFSVPRKTFYLGRWITHGGWYPGRRVRLAVRGMGRNVGTDPHDRFEVNGPVGNLSADLYHYTYRDIGDHLNTINKFTAVGAREMHEKGRGHALLHMLFNPPAKFLKMYLLRLGFLDGMAGFIIAVLSSYYVFLKYARLWELRRAAKETS